MFTIDFKQLNGVFKIICTFVENQTVTMQRLSIAIIFVLLFTSCDFFSSKKLSDKRVALANNDVAIDYSSVDTYPMFINCEGLDTKEEQEQCFNIELIARLDRLLLAEKIKAPLMIYDTVFVDLLIERDGKVIIAGIQSSELVKNKIPNLDSTLIASVNQLPYLTHPAIKRGIPVNSQYKLPILIKVID
ncbi:MAG: hypothetical protein L3J08_04715 [Flavobacteriaceae bacterium]|nr:hypothetical protein [Flavobacteriaceae bacterium]